MKREVLIRVPLDEDWLTRLSENFIVHDMVDPATFAAFPAERRAKVQAVIAGTRAKFTADDIASMPELAIIHTIGAGTEAIDIDAASARGIVVISNSGTNAASVADHAMALAMSLIRDVPAMHAGTVTGGWPVAERPQLTGKRVGILGLGAIGGAIAQRMAGFDTTIAYHSRRKVADVPWRYCAGPGELADFSDVLMVTIPATAETHHVIDAGLLARLGRNGFVVNVGRGATIDTAALAEALGSGAIAGAALDVFEGEPELPEILRTAPNLVVTPHVAGFSPEARRDAGERILANLAAFFDGKPVIGRVN